MQVWIIEGLLYKHEGEESKYNSLFDKIVSIEFSRGPAFLK